MTIVNIIIAFGITIVTAVIAALGSAAGPDIIAWFQGRSKKKRVESDNSMSPFRVLPSRPWPRHLEERPTVDKPVDPDKLRRWV